MKNIFITIALLASTLTFGQGLSSSARQIKNYQPEEFAKIELLLKDGMPVEDDRLLKTLINRHVKAMFEYWGMSFNTSTERKNLAKAMEESTEMINGVECVNYFLLVKILKG